jgi:hypothetical protein
VRIQPARRAINRQRLSRVRRHGEMNSSLRLMHIPSHTRSDHHVSGESRYTAGQ